MKRYGVTTIAHWMTEQFPPGIKAFVESQGTLFRLKRIKSYNGSIRPVLATLSWGGSPAEFTSLGGAYTLNTAVFLSMGTDLTGVTVATLANAVEPVSSNCWAVRATPDIPVTHNVATTRQAATENELIIPWCC